MMRALFSKKILLLAIIFINSCAYSNNETKYSKSEGVLLTDRIERGLAIIDDKEKKHRRVEEKVRQYKKDPSIFTHLDEERILIFSYILSELEKRNMPTELAMIPLVESSYRPSASNSGRHVGLWQLGAPTAKSFGVAVNRSYDGRYNLERSTEGALNYLEYLNERFDGDWLLTIAAYNAGEGRVMASMRRNKRLGKPTDYWSLSLPYITQEYIPKVLALSELSKNEHRLQRKDSDVPKLVAFDAKSRNNLQKNVKFDVEAISIYNPTKSINQQEGYTVMVPENLLAKKAHKQKTYKQETAQQEL